MIKGGTGGARTNENGLAFERKTSLTKAFTNAGYCVQKDGRVILESGNELQIVSGNKFIPFVVELLKLDLTKIDLSHYLKPDGALVNHTTKTIFIIEKKYQQVSGSVDEKIQTGPYKRHWYRTLVENTDYEIEFLYVLNSWFKQDKYKTPIDWLRSAGIGVHFEKLDLELFL